MAHGIIRKEYTLAEALTKRLKELEGDPDALFKMSGILGKPQAGFSWDELREEAINSHDYPSDNIEGVKLMTPAEYLEQQENKSPE